MARMIVEFVGPPGSGKTTLYERISECFTGRIIPAVEVNEMRLRILGMPLRTGFLRNDKNIQRVFQLSSLYRKCDPDANLLVEKGIYNLLYVMHVRGQRLRTSLGFKWSGKPTHLIALVREGIRRRPVDIANNEKLGYDGKIVSFYEKFISGQGGAGMKVLVLDRYGSVEEDLEKIRGFLEI